MKKILIPICALALVFMVAPMAMAASSQSGVTVTVGALTYDASPNVGMSVTATTTDYCISSVNTLTNTENGIEYATTSAATGYAQRPKTTAAGAAVVACDSATAIPSASDSTWVWMGGS